MIPLPATLEFLRRLWRLNHALERRSSGMHAAIGITAQQRMVLRCLGYLDGAYAGALAELLHLDPGSLSATLRRLEERNLIRRARDSEDSRRVRVALTAAGRRLDVPTPGTVEDAVTTLLATTPPEDVRCTMRVLEQFAALLDVPETPVST